MSFISNYILLHKLVFGSVCHSCPLTFDDIALTCRFYDGVIDSYDKASKKHKVITKNTIFCNFSFSSVE